MNLRETIRKILKEETEKDLSPIISKLLDRTIVNSNDNVCKIEVTAPWDRETLSEVDYIHYAVKVYFIGGPNTKNWPRTMAVVMKEENIMNEVWQTVYNFMGLCMDLYSSNVRRCDEFITTKKGEQKEGLHDTSWQNDEGDKITLMDLLNATEDIPVENISVEELKPHLLTWGGNEEESKKIDKADLQYPILIFVEDNGKFISIIDGHHRAQKAVRKGLKTIKAKVIPINSLPKDIRKVFGHMGKQEEMKEGELTEKCWAGYTQKGMKTMFGKRYPNCVKKKK
jgi:hypothetical protein